ncbi:MAG TPA: phage major capsid protein [Candidatus Dormibacteraeota bacterium]|nr:phage major capsid protein [Candidatus Dormibacteraeota bacterium]
MKVEVSTPALIELRNTIEEAERLSSKEPFAKREEQRMAFLLTKIKLLKEGATPNQIAKAEAERMYKAAGLAHIPTPNYEVEMEWRACLEGRSGVVGNPTDGEIGEPLTRSEVEKRANEAGQQSITYTQGPAGGYFVPFQFYQRLTETMKQYDQIFDDAYSNIIETESGSPITLPILDDVSHASTLVGETIQSGESDFVAGGLELKSYSYRSGISYVTLELLQDSGIPWATLLELTFARRHARGVGAALVNGTGSSQPTGLLTAALAAGAAVTIAGGSATNDGSASTGANSIGSLDLWNCYKGLNKAYRAGACWAMTDDTFVSVSSLLDKMGRPLMHLSHGNEAMLLGKPVAICPSMPEIGATDNSVIFYNPAYFYTRRVLKGMYVRAFSETRVEYGLTGFESWYRADSSLAAPDSSFVPAAVIQQHS